MVDDDDPYPAFPPDPDPYDAPPPEQQPFDLISGLAAAGDALDYWATHYTTQTDEGETLVEWGEDYPAWKWWGGRIWDFIFHW